MDARFFANSSVCFSRRSAGRGVACRSAVFGRNLGDYKTRSRSTGVFLRTIFSRFTPGVPCVPGLSSALLQHGGRCVGSAIGRQRMAGAPNLQRSDFLDLEARKILDEKPPKPPKKTSLFPQGAPGGIGVFLAQRRLVVAQRRSPRNCNSALPLPPKKLRDFIRNADRTPSRFRSFCRCAVRRSRKTSENGGGSPSQCRAIQNTRHGADGCRIRRTKVSHR